MLRLLVLAVSPIVTLTSAYVVNYDTACYLYPESLTHFGQPVDDTSSVLQAFELCGVNGTVIFTDHTFHMNQIMNTTNLLNCNIEIQGELVWSTNVPYWLSHSIGVGLQNQSTAWLLGGTNVSMIGGIFNGNGQTWYTQNRNNSNEPGRPIAVTFYNSTNLYIEGVKFIQPQFWATFVTHSHNVTMRNIYVNATSADEWGTVNTDGFDSWNSDAILLENWVVDIQDDCIALKGNTTNLHLRNVTCYRSNGMAIGSVGQYPLTPDYVENVLFEDVTLINSWNGAYIKTWQGIPQSNTENGDVGGGGSGLIRNVTFRNFNLTNVAIPIQVSQCIYTETTGADTCETSKIQIANVTWKNFKGTSTFNLAASIHCAASHPCPNIFFKDVDIVSVNATLGLPMFNTTLQSEVYQCANIVNENTTSRIPCNHWAPDNFGQLLDHNVQ